MARMASVRVLCIVTVGLFSWVSTTFAQTATPFVQRSSAPTRIATEREVVRQQRVDIQSPRDLISPARSAVLQLDLFPDLSFRAVRQRLDPTASGMSWSGVLEGYPDSSAVFVLSGDE